MLVVVLACSSPEEPTSVRAARTSTAPAPPRPVAAKPVTPPPEVERNRCVWITREEIAAIIGAGPYKEAPTGGSICQFQPREGKAPIVEVMLLEGPATFYERTAATGAEMMDVGDRAVWTPGAKMLTVVHGKKMFSVTLQEQTPPDDAHYYRRTAVAIARVLLKKI